MEIRALCVRLLTYKDCVYRWPSCKFASVTKSAPKEFHLDIVQIYLFIYQNTPSYNIQIRIPTEGSDGQLVSKRERQSLSAGCFFKAPRGTSVIQKTFLETKNIWKITKNQDWTENTCQQLPEFLISDRVQLIHFTCPWMTFQGMFVRQNWPHSAKNRLQCLATYPPEHASL